MSDEANVQEVVPFFFVASLEASLRFYVDGLGFVMTKQWIDDGKLRWCRLELGRAAIMLQERRADAPAPQPVGAGVSLAFQCRDALAIYRAVTARGLNASKTPFVGNNMWVVPLVDPDGYRVDFESPTDVAEDTELA
jgi:lactoylglutathione lyase